MIGTSNATLTGRQRPQLPLCPPLKKGRRGDSRAQRAAATANTPQSPFFEGGGSSGASP